jgi:4-oxalmesaconate hydratase
MVGAVKGIDPRTGHYFDDTRRYVDAAAGLSAPDRQKIYEANAMKVYPRLKNAIARQRATAAAVS